MVEDLKGDKRMTEEEYFRKTYPDSCYGDKPLSPYWDFFQDGVEFGERQSEKKVEDLENKIADIKANCDLAIEGRDIKIKELALELTVQKDLLQEETNLHLHAEEYIKSLEKEIAELKKWQKDTIKARGNDYMDWSRMKDQSCRN